MTRNAEISIEEGSTNVYADLDYEPGGAWGRVWPQAESEITHLCDNAGIR